ncbi:MAG: response regulator [Chloroflexi bacterium]|nr:response regulator [Chloroflexota bacterium]
MAQILLVEDSVGVRISVRETLTRAGYEVIEATNGFDAVTMYQNYHPDAVLLDIGMPSKDGLTALKEIREFDGNARVAMLTAYGFDHIVKQAQDSGAIDFVVKPFVRSRLVNTVRQMLEAPMPSDAERAIA